MFTYKDLIFVVMGSLIVYLVFRRGFNLHRRLSPIARYFNGRKLGMCDWSIPMNGRALRLRTISQSSRTGSYFLDLSWDIRTSEEWYLLPASARPWLMRTWNQISFDHMGKSWVIGSKHGDPATLLQKLKPHFDKYLGLFNRDFAILMVASESHVTSGGLKPVTLASFKGLPDHCEENPAVLIPYFEKLPQLVDEVSKGGSI